MSSNNYILISRKNFEVFEGCASNDYLRKIGKGKNLEEAVDISQKYRKELEENGSYVEYGVNFTDRIIKENLKG